MNSPINNKASGTDEMYVILGASGNTGSIIGDSLLSKGKKVRVVGRDAARLQRFVRKGAEAFTADLTDGAALAKTLSGARAAYLLLPPITTREDQERDSDAIAKAVKESGLPYAVNLSSYGAHVPGGTGPVTGLHSSEQKLNAISGLNVLHLRAAYFMENNLAAIGMIQAIGRFGHALVPDLKLPMIVTRDVGDYAAQRLLELDFSGKQTRELLGERDLSTTEATGVIARGIGKPDLRYVQFSVVTGGTEGIGFATAKLFVEEGAYVFITGRRQKELDEAATAIGSNGSGVQGDIAQLADLDRLYETVSKLKGRIDIVFANAGVGEFVPFGAVTEEHFDKLFNINVRGTLFTVQKALPLLKDGGSIILNGSVASVKGTAAFGVYAASKAAIRSFVRTWTTDLKDRHIRSNVVSPGPINTPLAS